MKGNLEVETEYGERKAKGEYMKEFLEKKENLSWAGER